MVWRVRPYGRIGDDAQMTDQRDALEQSWLTKSYSGTLAVDIVQERAKDGPKT